MTSTAGRRSSRPRPTAQTDSTSARAVGPPTSSWTSRAATWCADTAASRGAKNAAELFNLNSPISELRGRQIGSGTGNIVPGVDEVVSFKCGACGAEVSIDTNHAVQARCHWCRNRLSVNEQIANGAVPDVVLPFSLPKEEAVARISAFVSARKFFASRRFTAEFAPENVMGVYLPYLIIDMNTSVEFVGVGEHTTRSYSVRVDDNTTETRYDYDVYRVARSFNLYVDDLTIESAADKRDFHTDRNTNNIINSIMPFDTKNAVRYDPNYLSGFTSQRRDLDVDAMFGPARLQTQDIGRFRAVETLTSTTGACAGTSSVSMFTVNAGCLPTCRCGSTATTSGKATAESCCTTSP